MSDFLKWEDSELKELLGEWTEYDGEVSLDSWSEDIVDTRTKRSKGEEDQDFSKTLYECPLCNKQYKSVSGFRGHMVKKHDRTNIKAYDNKMTGDKTAERSSSTSTNCATSTSSSVTSSSNQTQSINIRKITEDGFTRFLNQGINKVMENKHHQSKFSKSGPAVIAVCRSVLQSDVLKDIENLLRGPFINTMSVYGQNMSFEKDQELMWTQFHLMRTDLELCIKLQLLVQQVSAESLFHIQGFIQGLFTDILQVIVSEVTNNIENTADDHNILFTEDDNCVIFYISGFLIKALSKKALQRNNTLLCTVLEGFCCKSSESSPPFLKKYKQWTEKVSRGGLKICGDNFFFAVRKMESICREKVDISKITATSTLRTLLIEAILENVTIQYYYHKLVPCVCSESLKASLLENIVNLFLKVRGKALAKLVQRKKEKSVKCAKKVVKKSLSLRKSLQRL